MIINPASVSASKLKGDIREAQFWDDFQRANETPIASPSPSGQPYVFLDFPTHGKPLVSSKELIHDPANTLAYYLQVVPGSTVINAGCIGRFVTGPGAHNDGHGEGVIIITDGPSFLPNNFLHLRWFFNQIVIEVTNTGLGGLRQVAVVTINSPINEVNSFQFTIEGSTLSVTAAGQSFKVYDAAFSETTWTTVIYENFYNTENDQESWNFSSIWANAPTPSVPGLTVQPYSPKLSTIAAGYGAFLNQGNLFTATQTIDGTHCLTLAGFVSGGGNIAGSVVYGFSPGHGTQNFRMGPNLEAYDDFTLTTSTDAGFSTFTKIWGWASGVLSIPGKTLLGSAGVALTRIRHGTSSAMTAGTIVVTDANVTASTRFAFSVHTRGTITLPAAYDAATRSAGTNFTITSSNVADTSTIDWIAFEP